jgi:hypothetical protein
MFDGLLILAVFYKRAVAALCRMLLCPNDYIQQGGRSVKNLSKEDTRANRFACIIVEVCLGGTHKLGYNEIAIVNHLDKLLLSDDYTNPGEAFILGKELQEAVSGRL